MEDTNVVLHLLSAFFLICTYTSVTHLRKDVQGVSGSNFWNEPPLSQINESTFPYKNEVFPLHCARALNLSALSLLLYHLLKQLLTQESRSESKKRLERKEDWLKKERPTKSREKRVKKREKTTTEKGWLKYESEKTTNSDVILGVLTFHMRRFILCPSSFTCTWCIKVNTSQISRSRRSLAPPLVFFFQSFYSVIQLISFFLAFCSLTLECITFSSDEMALIITIVRCSTQYSRFLTITKSDIL